MTNTSTPKTIADLQFQENVLELKSGQTPEIEAEKWFTDIYGQDMKPSVKRLFMEDGKIVYESYMDSGSVDYLYLVTE